MIVTYKMLEIFNNTYNESVAKIKFIPTRDNLFTNIGIKAALEAVFDHIARITISPQKGR